MRETVIQQILKQYGLQQSVVLSTEKGYRNESHPIETRDGRKLNIIVYKREAGILQKIRDANKVGDYLASQGFPARQTVDSRIIRLSNGNQIAYASLYHYLSGTTIPWEGYTMDHIKLLGKTMSDMHAALQKMPDTVTASVTHEYLQIIDQMQHYFSDEQVQKAVAQKLALIIDMKVLNHFKKTVRMCDNLPEQQTLHMDFVRSNILFSTSSELEITGIIDFEKTAYGSPLFDIARTLAFLLVDCKYKTPEKVRKYFLSSGYNKRGAVRFKNPAVEGQTLLDELTNLFLLYDFYKFLRHNPYEPLYDNEHFVRTRNILEQNNLLNMV